MHRSLSAQELLRSHVTLVALAMGLCSLSAQELMLRLHATLVALAMKLPVAARAAEANLYWHSFEFVHAKRSRPFAPNESRDYHRRFGLHFPMKWACR